MKRLFLSFLAIMAFAGFVLAGATGDWTGGTWDKITGVKATTVVSYSPGYNFCQFNRDRVWAVVAIDDTIYSGFANDLVYVKWGVQTYMLQPDSTGALDTVLGPRYVLDSMAVTSYTDLNSSVTNGGDSLDFIGRKLIDTLHCKGFAVEKHSLKYVPPNQYVRLWFQGYGSNETVGNLRVRCAVVGPPFTPILPYKFGTQN